MKFIVSAIGIAIFLLHTIPLYRTKINFGNILGIAFGIYLILISLLHSIIPKPIFIILGILTIIFLLAFSITLLTIIRGSRRTATNEDVVIVLGCRVKGTIPTKALLSRCESAYNHLEANPNSVAILTGGQGIDEDISEAQCMKQILLDKGIDSNRLIVEDKATNTDQNIIYSLRIANSYGLKKRYAIASNEYHIYRSTLIAKKYGISPKALPAHSIKFLRVPAFTREVVAVWWFYINKMKSRYS